MLQLQNRKSGKGSLWLVESKYSMGTNSDCDIVLSITEDAAKGVYADLLVNMDQVSIVNFGLTSIMVNGITVAKQAVIKVGDDIEVGTTKFQLVDPKAAKLKQQAEQQLTDNTVWSLKAMNTALTDKQFPINGSAVLGRSNDCDISLGVAHLSRRHARLIVDGNNLKVEDMGSSNGTFVNGKKIQSSRLLAGDELSFDTLRFRVIGPADDDRTSVRPLHDADMTTVRQALKVETLVQTIPSVKKTRAKPASKPIAHTEAAKPSLNLGLADHEAVESKAAGSSKLILIAIVLTITAGVAWYLIK